MQTNNFDLFRTKMNNENRCRQKFETRFITEGAAPIVIHILRLDKDREATMVFTDAEGPDTAIVFTPKQQEITKNLLKTDYYTWDNKMFFVYEDVIIPREVLYIKQKSYQCNIKVKLLNSDINEEYGGYFISSLRSYVDVDFQQKLNITDKEKPILIMPSQPWIEVGVKIEVGGKPWKIIDFDAITNMGITYMSLERDFFTDSNDRDSSEIIDTEMQLMAGTEYSFDTQDGYFNSSSPLIIKSKTADKVIFEVPYGLKTVTVSIKQNNTICEKQYKVII